MTILAMMKQKREIAVGMGMSAAAEPPVRLTAVVGSCIGMTLYAPSLHLGMLSHVVLPLSNGEAGHESKYADSAVVFMRDALQSRGAYVEELAAKIVGGAYMFGEGFLARIGRSNVEAALESLKAAGIRVAGCDVGGRHGRRLWLDPATGLVTVERVGCRPKIL
jgi:chemotaxis protein CheD